jgi:hypothetical protein
MKYWGESMLEMRVRQLAQRAAMARMEREVSAHLFAVARGYVISLRTRTRLDKPHIHRMPR